MMRRDILSDNPTIAILLSTYNGESYISTQIESLINQISSGINIQIHIRDDGSCDKTNSILKEFYLKYNNITIYDDRQERLGAGKSFFWLLSKVNANYYMFCDQDDVWFCNKVQLSYEVMRCAENLEVVRPIVVHSDLVVVDEHLSILHKSFWKYQSLNLDENSTKYLPYRNYLTGCTMMINSASKDLVSKYWHLNSMHDHLIAMVIDSFGGEIISIPVATIYYRQHSMNLIGAVKRQSFIDKSLRILKFPRISSSFKHFKLIKTIYSKGLIDYLIGRVVCIVKFGR